MLYLRNAFFAKICLLRSVDPDGSVILYRPSCSGRTRLGGFLGGSPSELSLPSTLIPFRNSTIRTKSIKTPTGKNVEKFTLF